MGHIISMKDFSKNNNRAVISYPVLVMICCEKVKYCKWAIRRESYSVIVRLWKRCSRSSVLDR